MDQQISFDDLFPGLPASDVLKPDFKKLLALVSEKENSNELIKEIDCMLKMQAILLLAFLDLDSPNIVGTNLNQIMDKMIPKNNPIAFLKSIFDTMALILRELGRECPEFTKVQNRFSFHTIFFSPVLKFNRIFLRARLTDEAVQAVWVSFLLISSTMAHSWLDKRFDALCGLIFKAAFGEADNEQSLDEMNRNFRDMLGYGLQWADYMTQLALIQEVVPTFGTPEFDVDILKERYRAALGRLDLDLLIFLNSLEVDNPLSLTQTPINRKSMSLRSPESSQIKNCEKGSNSLFDLNKYPPFEEVKNMCQSPETRRLSQTKEPMDHAKQWASAIDWYKTQINTVQIHPIRGFRGQTVPCTDYFSTHWRHPEVFNALKNAMNILAKIAPNEEDLVKFFYWIFQKLILLETKRNESIDVFSLIKNPNLLQAIVCLAVDLSRSINRMNHKKFEEILQACGCQLLDVWSIIHCFSKIGMNNLPTSVSLRLSELQYEILFRQVWAQPDPEYWQSFVLKRKTHETEKAVNQLIILMDQRVQTMAQQLGLNDQFIKRASEILKKLLLYGILENNDDADISFKFNVHIDIIILSVIQCVSCVNKGYPKMNQILKRYCQKVSFTMPFSLDDFHNYYWHVFKKKVKPLIPDQDLIIPPVNSGRDPLNSTPVQPETFRRNQMLQRNLLSKESFKGLGRRSTDDSDSIPKPPEFSSEHKRFPLRGDFDDAGFFGNVPVRNEPVPFDLQFLSPITPLENRRTHSMPDQPQEFTFREFSETDRSIKNSLLEQANQNRFLMEDTGIQTPTFK